MISTSLHELLDAQLGDLYIQGTRVETLEKKDDVQMTSVVTDSRQAQAGSIFVAIAGERVDGHDFVTGLSEDVALAVVDHLIVGAAVPQLLVENTVRALGDIARLNIQKRRAFAARGMNEFTIIGITGSVGKTTTKDMLHAVLSRLAPTVAPQGSFNNDIGLPLTALQVDEKTRFFVAEMGASAKGEIAYLTTIARPDISIVLKVGVAHLGGFGSVEGIRDAKSEIVRALTSSGVAILNADDSYVRTMADMTKASSIIWFSRENAQQQPKPKVSGMVSSVIVRGTDTQVDEDNRAKFSVQLPDGTSFDLRLGIRGEHNVFNALAVLSVVYSLDIPEHIAASVLSQMSTISAHRMHVAEVTRGETSFTVIDDSFNANPDSMRAGLKALASYKKADEGLLRIAVLGAMLELGSGEEDAHRRIGLYAAEHADAVIAVGSSEDENLTRLAACLADGAGQKAQLVANAHEANALVEKLAQQHHAVVLLKGSHASGLSALASEWIH
ncbi:UDP-N-acetylmuramoyl-tripeptide--D-alanyl-D-alanine ligase [Alloscardovia macacae]|uniref:UDP-N-acetylmuramoyl-tripeptide--D-alanyl-D-alanine ligase n=1 Tax=Alloscardovia macacae TaxID=1160091 RepID=A0A261F5L4_9BIFI|nr:UDP-N-acetylmuramoyl-tripeptide--D-alanyl-D-alanine ligase [Alloscardovia macacae]OZG54422.1 UDP-N-acetylmuramoyl-tripeptide--D-alanyl-D- alan ine ligase [Alloscardovia macacae]